MWSLKRRHNTTRHANAPAGSSRLIREPPSLTDANGADTHGRRLQGLVNCRISEGPQKTLSRKPKPKTNGGVLPTIEAAPQNDTEVPALKKTPGGHTGLSVLPKQLRLLFWMAAIGS